MNTKVILFLAALLISAPAFAQMQTDWQRDGLRGQVKLVTPERAAFFETFGDQ